MFIVRGRYAALRSGEQLMPPPHLPRAAATFPSASRTSALRHAARRSPTPPSPHPTPEQTPWTTLSALRHQHHFRFLSRTDPSTQFVPSTRVRPRTTLLLSRIMG
uniref:Uncharacterized protein n=1 Tax=Plectus sambesii TaxID=2011161 RepID=A0A914USR1_9BILA